MDVHSKEACAKRTLYLGENEVSLSSSNRKANARLDSEEESWGAMVEVLRRSQYRLHAILAS